MANTLSSFAKNTQEPTQEEQFAEHCAVKLKKAIVEKNWQPEKVAISVWTKKFMNLMKKQPQEHITNVLNWYIKNINSKYAIKVHSATSFVKFFKAFEERMKKDANLATISPDARKVMDELKHQCFFFRGITDTQLVFVIQQSLDNYVKFRANLMIAEKNIQARLDELTNNGKVNPFDIRDKETRKEANTIVRIQSFLEYARQYFKKPTTFVEGWMKKTSETIEHWPAYEGNLIGFIFALDHRRFEWMGRRIACQFFGDNGSHYWDRLVSFIPK